METQKVIQQKLSQLSDLGYSGGLDSVLCHIKIAEKHFERACADKDDHLFTDVIYRTNHAFEGILNESFSVIAGKSDKFKSPYEIEKFFLENKLFHPRVMDQFTHYRKEWRNPSTHDYQLVFSEQEAFLAILSVSAFVSILLDQIIESVARKIETERVSDRAEDLRKDISGLKDNLVATVSALALTFSKEKVLSLLNSNQILNERIVIGSLAGFIESVSPDINIIIEPVISYGEKKFRPDMLLERDGQSVILEIKNSLIIPGEFPTLDNSASIQQLVSIMDASDIGDSILYVYPLTLSMRKMRQQQLTFSGQKSILVIAPEIYFKGLCAKK